MAVEAPAALVLAYLAGCVPTAVWVSKWIYHTDIRTLGSGNAGLTNVIRVLGWKAGLPVAVFDLGKGVSGAWLGAVVPQGWMDARDFAVLTAAATVLGHSYTVLAGFRGGKGVLTSLGAYLFLVPWAAAAAFGAWTAILLITGWVSVASVGAGGVLLALVVLGAPQGGYSPLLPWVTAALFAFVVFRHRHNIVRVFRGTENRFNVGLVRSMRKRGRPSPRTGPHGGRNR